ncbi:MAG: hypothetical protein J0647_00755 [Campylobacteraceae bacterium]|nr:hypothetical protein [Campylobacteraceae bacterium]
MEMTIEEINLQIAQIEEKIQILNHRRSQNPVNENIQFEKMKNLIFELVSTEKLYYDYRTLLGFSLPGYFSLEEIEKMERLMPILEEKIKIIRQALNEIIL